MKQELKHKIGQMIVAGFPSPVLDDQARRLVEDFEVGNFAYFARNIVNSRQTNQLCRDLTDLVYAKTGMAPLICTDQEGGVVSRVNRGAALVPGTMAMAASASCDAYLAGKTLGTVVSALGVNTTFGPVLDVNLDPMNPIIGSRSFSDDTEVVTRLGLDMLRGLRDGGMPATLKHFPGHGNVSTDSHLGVPHNPCSREVLERVEWLPFRKAFEDGAEALMTCHVVFDQVDPDHPATLSHKIMTEILRDDMHFEGIAVTDCMEMDAIKVAYGIGPGAVMAIEAGCDMLCFSHTYEAVAEAAKAIYEAVESGRITEERIDLSYNRIVAVKKKFNLMTPPPIHEEEAMRLMYDPEMMAQNRKMSRDSMTLVYDKGGIAALKNAKRPAFFAPPSVALTGAEDKEKAPTYFSDIAAERLGGKGIVIPLDELDEATMKAIHDPDYDVAVLGLYNARFRKGQQAVIKEMEKLERPLIVVMLGAPYDAPLIQNADALIAAYEYTSLSAETTVDALQECVFPGKLPVKI